MIHKLLITGSRGSSARLMMEHLKNESIEIHGLCRSEQYTSPYKIENHVCDLNDAFATQRVLNDVDADCILHLASNADVRVSWEQPSAFLSNNIMSTLNILETMREYGGKLVLCSTSEVYGNVERALQPIKEHCQIAPINPYAVSKATQDMLGQVYGAAYNVDIVCTRMFGYINPDRVNLVATSFAKQIVEIEMGIELNPLRHGNLEPTRTFMDHRDVASAYWAACTQGHIGETYNIGSEQPITIGKILDYLCDHAHTKIDRRADYSLTRPVDIDVQIPHTAKFREHTGWKPQYDLYDSLDNLLDHWRIKLSIEQSLV